ncbi:MULTISPECIES: PH domain-containing protein [unclassified Exiguobacterium]|uniref:PH domain-containing protein n=1 Tax=unclassified Exiguobacterium TaxID=2644629 RepID=UPI001BEAEFB0|nr:MULTISPECIES: PH domain-containing protein [unclassified Exiguobacterium]
MTEAALTWHRLPSRVLLLRVLELIKSFIIPLVLLFVINNDWSSTFGIILRVGILLFLLFDILQKFFGWLNFRYALDEKTVYIIDGNWIKKEKSLPLYKIQSVHSNSPFLYRLLGVVELTFDTNANSDDASFKLAGVFPNEAKRLEDILDQVRHRKTETDIPVEGETDGTVAPVAIEKPSSRLLYALSTREIIIASLTSLSVFAIFPVASTIISSIDDFINLDGTFDTIGDWVVHASIIAVGVLVLAVLILSIVIGMVINFLKYGNFRLERRGDRIRVEKGLLNRSAKEIPYEKIQAVRVKETFIRRWFHIVGVELVAAGTMDELKNESSTILPFVKRERAMNVLNEHFDQFVWSDALHRLPKRSLWVKLLRISWVGLIVSGVVLYFFREYAWWLILLWAIIIGGRLLSYMTTRYAQNGQFIELRTGAFNVTSFLTDKPRIEQIQVTQTPLQRRFDVCNVLFSTRGVLSHELIEDIPKQEADAMLHWFSRYTVEEDIKTPG